MPKVTKWSEVLKLQNFREVCIVDGVEILEVDGRYFKNRFHPTSSKYNYILEYTKEEVAVMQLTGKWIDHA